MANWWQDTRFLVTGAYGFLGQHVIRGLIRRGAKHIAMPGRLAYDLRDRDTCRYLMQDVQPEVVIHLAAHVGGIGANQTHPAEYFYDNLAMGLHTIHEAWKAGVKKVVTVGTVCAYPKFTPVPFKEDDLWNGYPEDTNAPYGIAKKVLLVMGQAYRQQYGFNSIYLLPVNLYGPGDNFDPATSHVIPALIRKMVEAQERGDMFVDVWGTGSASREFLYVEDAAEGILCAAEHYDNPEPVNLGSGQEITIRALAEDIAEAVGYEGILRWDTDKPDGQPRRALDITRAREAFRWQASTPFAEGLLHTVAWFRHMQQTGAKAA